MQKGLDVPYKVTLTYCVYIENTWEGSPLHADNMAGPVFLFNGQIEGVDFGIFII